MAPGRRLGDCCWTCRLRRKRCDAVRPVCGSCKDLDISCHTGNVRPPWMDGGVQQKHMSETIKRTIKQNALFRKEKRRFPPYDGHARVSTIHGDLEPAASTAAVATSDGDDDNDDDDGVASTGTSTAGTGARIVQQFTAVQAAESSSGLLTNSSASPTAFGSYINSYSDGSEHPATAGTLSIGTASVHAITTPASSAPSAGLGIQIQAPAQQNLSAVMIYLDYVFPFLFPYYRPSLIETGRQWLLAHLCQNDFSFHTAASLSLYFFTLVPQREGEAIHDDCKAIVWDRLVSQMGLTLKTIQHDIMTISSQDAQQISLMDKTRIMEEIAQLLIVEVTVRRNLDWTVHLTPALSLFDEVFKSHGMNGAEPSLAVLLRALPPLMLPPSPHQKPMPNTSDQSALVFYTSLLLFVDIVASTSLGKAPNLKNYHDSLLCSQGEEQCSIRLESVIGCQNWPLVAIGKISTLSAWKTNANQSGSFSVLNLVNLAEPISQALDAGLRDLDDNPPRAPSPVGRASRRLEGYYSRHDRSIDYTSIATVSRVWAYAAKLYLSTILSGWQPNSTDVQDSVAMVVRLLKTIDSPAQLRSLSWPICVAGCFALQPQRQDFRDIVGDMGELGEFGTVGTALRIMEAVWNASASLDRDSLNFASFLGILGSSALLI